MHRTRTLRRCLAASFAVALIAAAAAPAAGANGFHTGKCEHVRFKQIDPLVAPSATDPDHESGHPHEFWCNDAVDASSTPQSLAAGGTSARVKSDKLAVWAPALVKDGVLIPSLGIEWRPINDADPDEAPVVIPDLDEGFSYIWGNPLGTVNPPTSGTKLWECVGGSQYTISYTFPASCSPGTTMIRAVTYNGSGCWDPSKGTGAGLGRGPGSTAGNKEHIVWNDLDCDPPYVKTPRLSIILMYPPEAAGGHFASDDHDGDGDPDVAPGTSLHIDIVLVDGFDSLGQSFWQRLSEDCLNYETTNVSYPKGVCNDNAAGQVKRLSPAKVVLEAGVTNPPSAEVPASAVDLLGYDHATGPAHWYSLTPVSPNPPWAPITPHPARVEAPPCDVFEKPLDWLHKSGKYTWTDDATEKATLTDSGWTNGGTKACTVPATAPASVPLFRCTLANGDAVLTTDEAQKTDLAAQGATVEPLGNVYPPA